MGKNQNQGQSLQFLAIDQKEHEKFNKKMKKLNKKTKEQGAVSDVAESSVVYIGHIPRGFFEPQMKAYFRQFGEVKRIRLARSKKTGASKGYAFVEFQDHEVAKVVADTMNNYLMYERNLKCHVVPLLDLHPATFKGCFATFRRPIATQLANKRVNAPKSEAAQKKIEARVQKKSSKLEQKLAALGVKYDMSQVRVNNGVTPLKQSPGASLDITNSTMNSTIDDTFFIVDESEEEVSFRIPPESAKKTRFIGGRSAIMNKSAPKPKFDLLAAAETKKTKSAKPKRSKAGKAKNLKK